MDFAFANPKAFTVEFLQMAKAQDAVIMPDSTVPFDKIKEHHTQVFANSTENLVALSYQESSFTSSTLNVEELYRKCIELQDAMEADGIKSRIAINFIAPHKVYLEIHDPAFMDLYILGLVEESDIETYISKYEDKPVTETEKFLASIFAEDVSPRANIANHLGMSKDQYADWTNHRISLDDIAAPRTKFSKT